MNDSSHLTHYQHLRTIEKFSNLLLLLPTESVASSKPHKDVKLAIEGLVEAKVVRVTLDPVKYVLHFLFLVDCEHEVLS